MFGIRDLLWSFLICALLTLGFQCRPAYEVRRFVERESQLGFAEAYSGHRYLTGELIQPYAAGGVHVDPSAATVVSRALEIEAERIGWDGRRAELVVHHAIQLATDTPHSASTTQAIHLTLEKQGGAWSYTSFDVQGQGPIAAPNDGNPWARALKPRHAPTNARTR